MVKWSRRDDEVVRRLVAILDAAFIFEFCGRHVMPPGTELLVGDSEGRVVLDPSGDLVFRVAPEYSVRIPFGGYHLETEEETRRVSVRVERWPTRTI